MRQHLAYQHFYFILGVLEEKRSNVFKNIFDETMAEKFPNLKKQISQVQNAQSSNRPIWGAIIIKMTKLKEKILKAGKQRLTYKG